MTEVIFQSARSMAVEIAGVVHFISTMPGRHPRPFQTTININGSCCMMDGPLSLPDSAEAMTAVTLWALRRDRLPNPQISEPPASGGPLNRVVGCEPENGETI